MNTSICFINRFTCFPLLPVHFLRELRYCFDITSFGGGYIVSFLRMLYLEAFSSCERVGLRL